MPPTLLEGFWSTMRDFQLAETTIPNKYKELIGLAVSGATRCKYCTLFHAEAAKPSAHPTRKSGRRQPWPPTRCLHRPS